MSLKAYEKAKILDDILKQSLLQDQKIRLELKTASIKSRIEPTCDEFNYLPALDEEYETQLKIIDKLINKNFEINPQSNKSHLKTQESTSTANGDKGKQSQPNKSKKYTPTWFSEIPALEKLDERENRKIKEATRKRLNQSNPKSVHKNNLPPSEDTIMVKGLNCKIGGSVDDVNDTTSSQASEEEPVLMDMTDLQLEQEYKPKTSMKELRKKKKYVKGTSED